MASAVAAGEKNAGWSLTLAVATWVLPGAGHVMRGQVWRGVVVGATILSLYFMGLTMGGLQTIDRHRPWFFAQAMVSAGVLLDAGRAQIEAGDTLRRAMDRPVWMRPGHSRMDEVGTLYTAMAGMLNVLCMLHIAGPSSSGPAPGARGSGAS